MFLGLDLLNEACDSLGWDQIDTLEKPESQMLPDHRKLVRLLNRLLVSIGPYDEWPLLRTEADIVTLAAVKGDGDLAQYVTATQNSTALTIDNITLDETYIGRTIQVAGDEYIYRIMDVTSATGLTLHRGWVSDSLTPADETLFTIAQDRYVLPENFGRPIDDWENFFAPYNIRPIAPYELRQIRRDRKMEIGEPEVFTVYGSQNNRQIVHFHPFPENARMISYEYQQNHPEITSDQDMVQYPLSYKGAFLDTLLHYALRDFEDSTKADRLFVDMLRAHNLQQSNPGQTDPSVQIIPSGETRQSIRMAYRYSEGISGVDWGRYFDTGWIYGF